MKLYCTPLSHFSRKVRLLLDFYSVPYEIKDIGQVTQNEIQKFGGNPLMTVPTLEDGDTWLIESDHIAQYLVSKVDANDQFKVFTRDLSDLNIRAILNGMMASEVKLILAKRTGVPIEQYSYFDKSLNSIRQAMAWLEENAQKFSTDAITYRELHLVCAWDHLEYYEILPMNSYGRLGKIVDRVSDKKFVQQTRPQVLKPKLPT